MANPRHRRHLVVSNAYPRQGDLYRYQFLHTRVKAYGDRGLDVDLFIVDVQDQGDAWSTYEFDGVTVTTGGPHAFKRYLVEPGTYDRIAVHFPMPYMLDVLDEAAPSVPVALWLHGYEAEAWWRRWFNIVTSNEEASLRRRQQAAATHRTQSLASFLDRRPDTVVVSVSRWFLKHVIQPDVGDVVGNTVVIPNPIDTHLFSTGTKSSDLSGRVLVIRPFTSAKYAGDQMVEAVLRATEATKGAVSFTICGDGPQFDASLAPLRVHDNVEVRKGFLTPSQMADLHRSHGVFLAPTWWDSQGVATCEAMSSALVPVSSAVAAVPEFIEHDVSGLLAPAGDARALAEHVVRLAGDPELFARLSAGAAQRVREQSALDQVISREIDVLTGRRALGTTEPVDWRARYVEVVALLEDILAGDRGPLAANEPTTTPRGDAEQSPRRTFST